MAGKGAIDDERVRVRAYLLWEAGGRPEGQADHYWSLARDELAAEIAGGRKPKQKRADAAAPAREKKSKGAGAGGKKAGKRKS